MTRAIRSMTNGAVHGKNCLPPIAIALQGEDTFRVGIHWLKPLAQGPGHQQNGQDKEYRDRKGTTRPRLDWGLINWRFQGDRVAEEPT
jgi:hypothetical protein